MPEWLLNLPDWFWLLHIPSVVVSYGLCKKSLFDDVPSNPGIIWVLFIEGVSLVAGISSIVGIFATYVTTKVFGIRFAFRLRATKKERND